jgi:chemotaxis protein MotB
MADTDDIEEITLARPKKASSDEPEPECPPCKSGAPAWMATFADMATLLMAFFVLLLSFANTSVPKYKNISGSMQMAFGVQTLIPVVEPPEAKNLIATQYMTAEVQQTPVQTIEEQRTDEPQPVDPELDRDVAPADSQTNDAVEMLETALADQIAAGKISISVTNQTVTLNLLDPDSLEADNSPDNQPSAGQISAELLDVFAAVVETAEQTSADIEVMSAVALESEAQVESDSALAQSNARSEADNQYETIRRNLANEIRSGLASVSRDGDNIIIRLAEQGSFTSGNAELQQTFLPLLESVATSLSGSSGSISVEGHTDNVSMAQGGRYRTNWDLSSARAAAVADYILGRSQFDSGQISVSGYADTRPIADNETALGRAQNRRIEIIVTDQ